MESIRHGIISHYFEALGSSAKQEWPLLRKTIFLHKGIGVLVIGAHLCSTSGSDPASTGFRNP
jgi:hypothetical protein